jgi:cell division transport system permease protein
MIFRRFFYGLKEGIRNIFRNKIFSLASIGTIMACVFLLGVTLSVILNVRSTVRQMESSVGVSAFFESGISQEEKEAIGQKIQAMDGVATAKYVSAEEAWEQYKTEVFKDNEELLEGFEGENPLNESDSYEITLREVGDHEAVVKELESMDGIRSVKYSEVAAEGISKINTLGTYIAGAIILILLLVSVFLVSNTVSLGISVRRKRSRSCAILERPMDLSRRHFEQKE